jgi:hypothetical protein
MIPATLPSGQLLEISLGKRNPLQAAVIGESAPRLAPGAEVLCFGDAARREGCQAADRIKHVARETEVWVAEIPEHLIHFNGNRFLGRPRPWFDVNLLAMVS